MEFSDPAHQAGREEPMRGEGAKRQEVRPGEAVPPARQTEDCSANNQQEMGHTERRVALHAERRRGPAVACCSQRLTLEWGGGCRVQFGHHWPDCAAPASREVLVSGSRSGDGGREWLLVLCWCCFWCWGERERRRARGQDKEKIRPPAAFSGQGWASQTRSSGEARGQKRAKRGDD